MEGNKICHSMNIISASLFSDGENVKLTSAGTGGSCRLVEAPSFC